MKLIVFMVCLTLLYHSNEAIAQKNSMNENKDTTTCLAHDTIVYINVEKSAKFQDGDILKFRKYVAMNICYPSEAFNNLGMQGKSYVKFIVDWDGQVKEVSVFKSSGFEVLDNEAVRVVRTSPLWCSAKINNVCVPQQFILPIEFKHLGVTRK
jgi:TonB family protein